MSNLHHRDFFVAISDVVASTARRPDINAHLRAIALYRRLTEFAGRPDERELEAYLARHHPAADIRLEDQTEGVGGVARSADEIEGVSEVRALVSRWAQAEHVPDVKDILTINRLVRGLDRGSCELLTATTRQITGRTDGAVRYRGAEAHEIESLLNGMASSLSDAARLAREDPSLGILLSAGIHLQLVLIHPFSDGNGRTARALSRYIQMRAGLDLQVPALEEYYLWDRRAYERSLMIQPSFNLPLNREAVASWLIWMTTQTRGACETLLKASIACRTRRALQAFISTSGYRSLRF